MMEDKQLLKVQLMALLNENEIQIGRERTLFGTAKRELIVENARLKQVLNDFENIIAMANNLNPKTIFIAFNNSAKSSKDILMSNIHVFSNRNRSTIHLDTIDWTEVSRSFVGKRKQDELNDKLSKSDIAMFVVDYQMGDYTLEEFEKSLEYLNDSKCKLSKIIVFADKNIPHAMVKKVNFDKLIELLSRNGGLYCDFDSKESLEKHIDRELNNL